MLIPAEGEWILEVDNAKDVDHFWCMGELTTIAGKSYLLMAPKFMNCTCPEALTHANRETLRVRAGALLRLN